MDNSPKKKTIQYNSIRFNSIRCKQVTKLWLWAHIDCIWKVVLLRNGCNYFVGWVWLLILGPDSLLLHTAADEAKKLWKWKRNKKPIMTTRKLSLESKLADNHGLHRFTETKILTSVRRSESIRFGLVSQFQSMFPSLASTLEGCHALPCITLHRAHSSNDQKTV